MLDRIRPGALALYAGTMSFEALHAVTGCHWLRVISPCRDEPQRLAMHFWEVVFALYTKIGMPAAPLPELLDTWRRLPLPSDQDIAAAAVASNDEHDHSLAFSALEEYRHTGDRLYKVVAARRLGLIARSIDGRRLRAGDLELEIPPDVPETAGDLARPHDPPWSFPQIIKRKKL